VFCIRTGPSIKIDEDAFHVWMQELTVIALPPVAANDESSGE
jgi:hypothetical protein